MFEIDDLIVGRSARLIINRLGVQAPSPGVLTIIGPGGMGKSTLLRAVSGCHGDELSVSGQVHLDGRCMDDLASGVGFYAQRDGYPAGTEPGNHERRIDAGERLALSAHRKAALAAFLREPHSILVLDEPFAALSDSDLVEARAMVKALAANAFVLLATHSRQDCLAMGGVAAIFADGAIVEAADPHTLFTSPSSEAARHYVESGNITGFRAQLSPQPVSEEGIWWVVPGLIGGMSRPGLVAPGPQQFAALTRAGAGHLVCLEERVVGDAIDARGFGIVRHHFAVTDMRPPAFNQAVDFCRLAEGAIAGNNGIVFHCRGGLGRTGTAIAAVLIWHGDAADAAIARVRAAQPRAIQTEVQEKFLHEFADRVRDWQKPAAISHPMETNNVT